MDVVVVVVVLERTGLACEFWYSLVSSRDSGGGVRQAP